MRLEDYRGLTESERMTFALSQAAALLTGRKIEAPTRNHSTPYDAVFQFTAPEVSDALLSDVSEAFGSHYLTVGTSDRLVEIGGSEEQDAPGEAGDLRYTFSFL